MVQTKAANSAIPMLHGQI